MSEHQSKLKPTDNKFHVGNGEDGQHYWITPVDLYTQFIAIISIPSSEAK